MKNYLMGNRKPVSSSECFGFLDKEVKLDGTIEISGMFRIDCQISGQVRSQDRLILGENARVQGDIEGDVISVAGKITGDVHAAKLVEILPSGVVEGDIHTPSLVIQPGGVLDGRCHMREEVKLAVTGPKPVQSVPALASKQASG